MNLAGSLVEIAEGSPTLRVPTQVREPGERVRVYTNLFRPKWGGFLFGYGRAVRNHHDPDQAGLFDPQGRRVATRGYPPGY